jgi:hypothetical protein
MYGSAITSFDPTSPLEPGEIQPNGRTLITMTAFFRNAIRILHKDPDCRRGRSLELQRRLLEELANDGVKN